MKLGIVTYQIGKDWDVPALIDMCQKTGMQGVELRTQHAHGVELELSSQERKDVRNRFGDGGIEIAGLGSTCEYHSDDAAVVRENVEQTLAFAQLAADLGCPGVKVRPNGLQDDVDASLEQIGKALNECGKGAADCGVQIRCEVHGKGTSDPRHMKTIMDHADHPNVAVCWNSNPREPDEDGSIRGAFDLLKNRIGLVHITELHRQNYPWIELFALLKASGYNGYTLAEIPASPEPERLLSYYRALWQELQK